MSNRHMQTECRIETHRALVKILQYAEDECGRAGFSTACWMLAMTRDLLESELAELATLKFDEKGHPRLN